MQRYVNTISVIFIIGGVILGAIYAAHIPPHWGRFALANLLLILGILGLQMEKKKTRERLSRENRSKKELYLLFDELLKEVRTFQSISNPKPQTDFTDKIENALEHYLLEIEKSLPQISEIYGMTGYVNILSPYARAERLIQRGISAAIDGFPEETATSLNRAEIFLEKTLEALDKTSKGN